MCGRRSFCKMGFFTSILLPAADAVLGLFGLKRAANDDSPAAVQALSCPCARQHDRLEADFISFHIVLWTPIRTEVCSNTLEKESPRSRTRVSLSSLDFAPRLQRSVFVSTTYKLLIWAKQINDTSPTKLGRKARAIEDPPKRGKRPGTKQMPKSKLEEDGG
ncbi:hypothetical protein NA56DRAFT_744546 [Hyaloscypha hepaticicola]|uniref:Secreted protein n=1 Tax=Hyaloscypha hepaticicola TaxID=2082293 RepID=A0A2J6QJD5_9HELO|nr:hypothetical protein NA56DRAFT_744546 [Hyaloscypha hepaticicola]